MIQRILSIWSLVPLSFLNLIWTSGSSRFTYCWSLAWRILSITLLGVHWKDWCWCWNSNTLATWCEELTHWKRPQCWERLRAGGEGGDRGWDGWMASLTRWMWVWVNSRSWWNASWSIWNPQRRCCESSALNIPANMEISAVATRLEKVSFYSSPKQRQWQRMFKLPHNHSFTH